MARARGSGRVVDRGRIHPDVVQDGLRGRRLVEGAGALHVRVVVMHAEGDDGAHDPRRLPGERGVQRGRAQLQDGGSLVPRAPPRAEALKGVDHRRRGVRGECRAAATFVGTDAHEHHGRVVEAGFEGGGVGGGAFDDADPDRRRRLVELRERLQQLALRSDQNVERGARGRLREQAAEDARSRRAGGAKERVGGHAESLDQWTRTPVSPATTVR